MLDTQVERVSSLRSLLRLNGGIRNTVLRSPESDISVESVVEMAAVETSLFLDHIADVYLRNKPTAIEQKRDIDNIIHIV